MHLILPRPVLKRLHSEMRRAKRREIGGLLLGEHVEGETFRLVDVTVQRTGGSEIHFIRDPSQHQQQLDEFFHRTGANFAKFNYLGEWHSHPSFEPLPSSKDIATMQSIVENPDVGVNFLVLVISRVTRWRQLRLSAMLFQPNMRSSPVSVSVEGAPLQWRDRTVSKILRAIIKP